MNNKMQPAAEKTASPAGASEEQLAYAKLMNIGMKLGMLLIIVTFAIYVFGVFEPQISFEKLTDNWDEKKDVYFENTGAGEHTGWSWTGMLNKGDYLNFLGIAFLGALTVVCYLRILPILIRKKDYIYVALAVVEVLVLVLAASGVLKGGGH